MESKEATLSSKVTTIAVITAATLALLVSVVFSGQAMAAKGGAPALHGVDGKTWGMAVSGLAQSEPGALAEHTSGGKSGGAPGLHGLSGSEWGAAVSGLAQSQPGAVADHVSN